MAAAAQTWMGSAAEVPANRFGSAATWALLTLCSATSGG